MKHLYLLSWKQDLAGNWRLDYYAEEGKSFSHSGHLFVLQRNQDCLSCEQQLDLGVKV